SLFPKGLDSHGPQASHGSEPDAVSAAKVLEVVRKQNQDLETQLNALKEQHSTTQRQLWDLHEREKQLQNEIKQLKHTVSTAQQGAGQSLLKGELDATKKQLAKTKERELEVVKKLAVAVEQIKTLKREMKNFEKKSVA